MLLVKNIIFAQLFAIVFAPIALGQTFITYDTLNRIASVSDLLVNGTTYDVTTTYNVAINGATPGIGDIPDADIDAAVSLIVGLSFDTSSGDPVSELAFGTQGQTGNASGFYTTEAQIERNPSTPSNSAALSITSVASPADPTFGYATFTAKAAALPEPSVFALAGGLSLLGIYSHRRRRRVMQVGC